MYIGANLVTIALYSASVAVVICGPADFYLTLSNRVGTSEALMVRQMILLKPTEAAALPKDERP
jgi:hypothetical protein